MSIEVLAPGLLTTVQDLGRRGHSAIGVGGGGAMDDVALRLANALVGNEDSAAALEITLRGPRLRFDDDTLIAITGGEVTVACDDRMLPLWRPLRVTAGSILDVGALRTGARSYLAVAGGIELDLILGSRGTDINAGIGPLPRPLMAGDRLPSPPSRYHRRPVAVDAPGWSLDPAPWFDAQADRPIAVMRGAHFDRLDADSRRLLFAAEFRVASQSNRVGYRFDGPRLTFVQPVDLVSEGTVPGTVQLPPDGQPIVLMAEAPTSGGYPRIAQVASISQGALAQRRPGQPVRFVEISIDEAQTRYLRRERELRALRGAILERLNAWLS